MPADLRASGGAAEGAAAGFLIITVL